MLDIKELFEKTWLKAIFRPIEKYKPPVPKIVYNPRLKRMIARAKARITPVKIKGGKIISYSRVTEPVIEVSPFFKKLSKKQKEKVLEHEIMHIIHAGAFPGRRQLHREGSLFSMEKIMLKWKKKESPEKEIKGKRR